MPPHAPLAHTQAKFGIPVVAANQLELYSTAVLLASVKPPAPPRCAEWAGIMDTLSDVSCQAYRCVRVCACVWLGGGEGVFGLEWRCNGVICLVGGLAALLGLRDASLHQPNNPPPVVARTPRS